jgi:hypothetical protein
MTSFPCESGPVCRARSPYRTNAGRPRRVLDCQDRPAGPDHVSPEMTRTWLAARLIIAVVLTLAAIGWATIAYGAVLSAVAAALLVFAAGGERRVPLLASAAAAGALGPLLWNAILHHIGGSEFFVDAPVAVMPASWQDTGSGVFTVAVATVLFGFGSARKTSAQRLAILSLLCGLGAFLVDVYLY